MSAPKLQLRLPHPPAPPSSKLNMSFASPAGVLVALINIEYRGSQGDARLYPNCLNIKFFSLRVG